MKNNTKSKFILAIIGSISALLFATCSFAGYRHHQEQRYLRHRKHQIIRHGERHALRALLTGHPNRARHILRHTGRKVRNIRHEQHYIRHHDF